jgi:hypothetical protein
MDSNVPYAENGAVKALGAKWDPTRRTWYVPPGVDINKFAYWKPEIEAWNRAADGRGEPPRPRKQRRKDRCRKRIDKVSGIVHAASDKDHVVPECSECMGKLPWDPQCPACTSAFETRRAILRAQAGLGRTGADSFEEFMDRQLHLSLVEPVQ